MPSELEIVNHLSIRAFADRFQQEQFGVVYYKRKLGDGGYLVTAAEAQKYVTEHASIADGAWKFANRNARRAIYGILFSMILLFCGVSLAGELIVTMSIIALLIVYVRVWMKPAQYRKRVSDELSKRVLTKALSRQEKIQVGFAWPLRKNLAYWLLGMPLVAFVMLHKAGPHGLERLLGTDLAHKYNEIVAALAFGFVIALIAALPIMYANKKFKKKQ